MVLNPSLQPSEEWKCSTFIRRLFSTEQLLLSSPGYRSLSQHVLPVLCLPKGQAATTDRHTRFRLHYLPLQLEHITLSPGFPIPCEQKVHCFMQKDGKSLSLTTLHAFPLTPTQASRKHIFDHKNACCYVITCSCFTSMPFRSFNNHFCGAELWRR